MKNWFHNAIAVLLFAGLFHTAKAQTYIDVAGPVGLDLTNEPPGTCSPPLGTGSAWADYDNDGDIDLFVTNIRLTSPNHLYRNDGDTDSDGLPNFTDVADALGVGESAASAHGAVFADYDNDGDQDLFVTNWGWNTLYQNQLVETGSVAFVDVTDFAGVRNSGRAITASWGDYNQDGFLDLYLAKHRYCTGDDQSQDVLFRSNGNGTFTDVSGLLCPGGIAPCAEIEGLGFVGGWLDYDNDADLDLYLVNDNIGGTHYPNVLWRNDGSDGGGGWTFTDVSVASGTNISLNGMGLGVGDYDNDGWLDLAFSNIGENYLLRNKGDGTFEDVSAAAGIQRALTPLGDESITWGTVFFDYDNNGLLDLYIAAGNLGNQSTPQPNAFFGNNGNGTFTDLSAASGLDNPDRARCASIVDFDQDGFVDVFVDNITQYPILYHNESVAQGNTNHWLIITAEGTTSNRDGVGTRLSLTANGVTQIREITSGPTYGGGDFKAAYFGLGSETSGNLEVRWPTGVIENLGAVSADQSLHLVEGAGGSFPPVVADIPNQTINDGDSFSPISLDDYVNDPDHLDADMTWTFSGNTDLTVAIDINRVATITAPGDWQGSETLTFTATDPGALSDSDAASFTVLGAPSAALRMNTGGSNYTDINGDLFELDRAYAAGDLGYLGGTADTTSRAVTGTSDPALYQTLRIGTNFSYVFDLANGDYNITCYFVEATANAVERRVFDVTAEGVVVLDNFDIFAVAGRLVAHNETFGATVADGQLNLDFDYVTGVGDPLISAISVVSLGAAPSEPDISVTPVTLDFGSIDIGQFDDAIVTVSNVGSEILTVSSLTTSNGVFSVVSPATPFDVATGGNQAVTVRFTPGIAQVENGNLDIISNDADEGTVTLTLTGNGVTPPPDEPDISVSPASADFGQVIISQTSDAIVTLTNAGTQILTVSDLSTTNGVFTVISPATPFDVAASGGTQDVTIRFSPTIATIENGDLNITSNDPDAGVVTVSLTGTGITDPPPTAEYRINTGGSNYTDANSDLFEFDRAYVAGDFGYQGGTADSTGRAVTGTSDPALYQTLRSGTNFSYVFDLANGNYNVTCYFVEATSNTPDRRVFDVTAEGIVALDNFDIFAIAGRLVAHNETFSVTVSDGQLNLAFDYVSGLGNPLVSAIFVQTTGAALVSAPSTHGRPSSIQFGTQAAGQSVSIEMIPEKMMLEHNYPNPFNPSTRMGYGLNQDTWVTLKIYNTLGQEVITLVNEFQTAGFKSVVWNGKDRFGDPVSSGVYIYKMATAEFSQIRKMVFAK